MSSNTLHIVGGVETEGLGRTWKIAGIKPDTSLDHVDSAIDLLLQRCRARAPINTKCCVAFSCKSKSNMFSREAYLWELKSKVLVKEAQAILSDEVDITFSVTITSCTALQQYITMPVLVEKGHVVLINEKPVQSLIYAFYYAVRYHGKTKTGAIGGQELLDTIACSKGGVFDGKLKIFLSADGVEMKENWGFEDIPVLEYKYDVRCVVIHTTGFPVYEGSSDRKSEVMLLWDGEMFHFLKSKETFRPREIPRETVEIND